MQLVQAHLADSVSTTQADGPTNSLLKSLCADRAQQELRPLWCLHWHGCMLMGQVCVNISKLLHRGKIYNNNNIYVYIYMEDSTGIKIFSSELNRS